MTSETFLAREDQDAGSPNLRENVQVIGSVLAASGIRFDTTARQHRPIDPSLDETVANPVWSRTRVM